jgi:hypothetical protein
VGSGGFSRFWLVIQGDERDLRRVQELVGPLFGNRVDEYAVSRASDEVADVFITDKRGHGFAESRTGIVGCEIPSSFRSRPCLPCTHRRRASMRRSNA